jgi:hypothetical protein
LLNQPGQWPERMIFSAWNQRVSVRTQTHRLDSEGRLFDMFSDPGQTTPINDKEPALAATLSDAVKEWRREVQVESEAAGRGAVDPRPIPVGYREFPITMLPARDGEPRGSEAQQQRPQLLVLCELDE